MDKETLLRRYADWSPNHPDYRTMAAYIRRLEQQMLQHQAVVAENRRLRGELKSSRDQVSALREEKQELARQLEALKKQPTDSMLQRALAHVIEQEEQARLIKRMPLVKCPRTGVWKPRAE
jgi:predicted nuclease with TOPRIM domain